VSWIFISNYQHCPLASHGCVRSCLQKGLWFGVPTHFLYCSLHCKYFWPTILCVHLVVTFMCLSMAVVWHFQNFLLEECGNYSFLGGYVVTIISCTLSEIIFYSCMAILGIFTTCEKLRYILIEACELWTFSFSVIFAWT